MTSPGMKLTERKTRTLRMNRVGMTSNNRLMTWALMVLALSEGDNPLPPSGRLG
jgi:hypothetical protein